MKRLLLDTHILLWALDDDPRLSAKVRNLLRGGDAELYWSAASTWELAIKSRLKKIAFHEPLGSYIADVVSREGLVDLPVSTAHAARVAELPLHHRDPFDRLLVAQAQCEDLVVVTSDKALRKYDVEVLF